MKYLQFSDHLMMKDLHKFMSPKTQNNPLRDVGIVAFESWMYGRTDVGTGVNPIFPGNDIVFGNVNNE